MNSFGASSVTQDSQQQTKISHATYWFAYACFIGAAGLFLLAFIGSGMHTASFGSALGALLAARWAVSEWRKIKKAENAEELKATHLATELKCVAGLVIVLAVAGVYGHNVYQKNQRNLRLHDLAVKMDATESRNAAIRSKFVNAVREHASSMSTYIQRCKDVESTLGDYESALREVDGQLADLADLMPKDKANTEVMLKLVAIDLESLQSYRREVMLAKQLAGLSPENQQTFFQNNIVPIQSEEERFALQEIKLMQDAKASGITLPDNLSKIANQ